MRIGIEAQRIFRSKKHGMDFVALELIKHLQLIDNENDYFIFVNSGENEHIIETSHNFTLVQFKAPYMIWEQIMLPIYCKKYNLDVLHCTSNTAPIFSTVPLVVTIHDIIFFEKNPLSQKGYTSYQKFGNFYRRLVVGVLLKTAKKIITVSEYERGNFLKRFRKLDSNRLIVVLNGVGEHFRPEINDAKIESVRKLYKLPKYFALFLGNTDPKKNTKNTLLGFARSLEKGIHNWHLVVADLEQKVAEDLMGIELYSKVKDRLHFPGYIENQHLPVVMSEAQCMLYPSLRESFGIPILEGMACGAPVITSNRASMPEVAGDAALMVDPENIDDIASSIMAIAHDPILRGEFIKKGLIRASNFHWMDTALDVKKVYQSII